MSSLSFDYKEQPISTSTMWKEEFSKSLVVTKYETVQNLS